MIRKSMPSGHDPRVETGFPSRQTRSVCAEIMLKQGGEIMPRHIKALIVVPENNTTMEPEISVLCPALVPIAVARVKRPARTLLLEDLPAYAEATLEAIAPFAAESLDLVIHGCTAAGFLGGPGSNAQMVERLRERAIQPGSMTGPATK
jgi:maleate cis-trans isomerase